MGMGVPTIVSGVTSLPEATLGKASYVQDPLDARLWSEQMIAMLKNGERPALDTVRAVRDAFDPRHVATSLLEALR
jgi:glycosyltransferase involved in cell wall biosynthesis